MGSLTWKQSLPGNWSTGASWTVLSGTDTVPGAADDAAINLPLNYVVTLDGTQAVHDLLLDGSGARLSIAGSLLLGATLTAQSGSLEVRGILSGGTIDLAGAHYSVAGSLLAGTTWMGALELDGTVSIFNGLTVLGAGGVGPGTIIVDQVVNLLDTNPTLDNASVTMGAGALIQMMAGNTLTLGPNLVVHGEAIKSSASIGFPGPVHNLGTVLVEGELGGFGLAADFTNDGLVAAVAGGSNLNAVGDVVNHGTISIGDDAAAGIAGDLENTGTLIGEFGAGLHAAQIRIQGDLTGGGLTVLNNAWLSVSGTIDAGTHIVGQAGTMLVSARTFAPGVTIEGFSPGSALDFKNVTDDGNVNVFWSGTPAGGTLTVMDGVVQVGAVYMTGIPDGSTFSVGSWFGNDLTVSMDSPACFAAGTRIRTPEGDVPVEQLRIGDRVVSAFGGSVAVTWIGSRRIRASRHRRPAHVWPILVCAGALDAGVPARDLRLSPEHAVLIDGLLVPVGLLVNGRTIVQERCAEVVYYHVELPQHDVVLAEGVPCESYLDTGNRSDFDNGTVVTAHPAFSGSADEIWRAMACAPQCRGGERLERIRKKVEGCSFSEEKEAKRHLSI